MAENSKIEWTTHTFNPWIGCSKVAAGCEHCYAEEMMAVRYQRVKWGAHGTRSKTKTWRDPIRWNKEAAEAGERHRVFCASLADVFEDRPELEPWRRELFYLIDATPNLDWLLLTKRPENMRRMWRYDAHPPGCPIEFQSGDIFASAAVHFRFNVWLGTSIATQADADRNIPELLKCRDLAPVLFLSCEPLLGPVSLAEVQVDGFAEIDCLRGKTGVHRPLAGECPKIDWVIVGGESGPKARPMHPDWSRSIRDQCQAAGTPFFFKQWGEWVSDRDSPSPRKVMTDTPFGPLEISEKQAVRVVRRDGGDRVFNANGTFSGEGPQQDDAWMVKVGKKRAGRLLDGVEHSQFPEPAHA